MTKKRKIWRILGIILLAWLVLFGATTGYLYYLYREIARDLPPLNNVLEYHPMRASHIYASDGTPLGEFFTQNRVIVPLGRVPEQVRNAFIAAEDQNFYKHRGWDPKAIIRAAWKNLRAGQVVQGGSTITQQVVKTLIVGKERSYRRKIREAVLAYRLEQKLSKDRIFEIYLNEVYLGSGAYGVEAASRVYFGKSVHELTLAETAMIAGLSKAPSRDSPHLNRRRAKERQKYALNRLVATKKITQPQADRAYAAPLHIKPQKNPNQNFAGYFIEHVRKYLVEKYGNEKILTQGLVIQTTLDPRAQRAAEEAIKKGLKEIIKDYDAPSPIDKADEKEFHDCLALAEDKKKIKTDKLPLGLYKVKAVITRLNQETIWLCARGLVAKLAPSDSRKLASWRGKNGEKLQKYDVVIANLSRTNGQRIYDASLPPRKPIEASLITFDLETGAIRAMVGGSYWKRNDNEFNRAIQARRQAGSAIKPLIYAAAMANGFNEMTILEDAPIAVETIGGRWEPKNYKREFLGPITLRTAFAKSINTVSVRLALALELGRVIAYFKELGITSAIPNHISVSLGTIDVSLLELTRVYATFPRGGMSLEPYFIARVTDTAGNVLEEHQKSEPRQRLSPEVSYIIVDLMKAVISFGTGRRARDFPRPTAGKTGTSTDYRDAWFIGYTADLITGVWVGRDDFMPIGFDATGGRTALPIWLNFMQNGHPDTPIRDFDVPPGIIFHPVNTETGQVLDENEESGELVPFIVGNEPASISEPIK